MTGARRSGPAFVDRARTGRRSTTPAAGDVALASGAAVLDAARNAGPGTGTHHRPRPAAQAVRPAAVGVPERAVPADRRRGRAQRAGDAGQVRAVERRHGRAEALDDALALRMAALEAAEVVFRVCHQLHGAVGFCDETTLSWLSRYSQPLRRLPFGLSATRDQLTRTVGTPRAHRAVHTERRSSTSSVPQVRAWCAGARAQPTGAQTQTGVERRRVRRLPEGVVRRTAQPPASPCRTGPPSGAAACRSPNRSCCTRNWPRTTRRGWCWRSSGSTTPRPRCWSRAPTSSARRHLPAILDGEIWVQGFSEPEAGSDLASLRTTARRDGDDLRRQRPEAVGQRRYARRLVPAAGPHRSGCAQAQGISYFLMDMTTPGIDVRPIRNAIGDSHFCEIFLNDVDDPGRQPGRCGERRAGRWPRRRWAPSAGMTMLELAERLGNAGFRWLVEACQPDRRPRCVRRSAGAVRDRDHRPARTVPRPGARRSEAAPSGRPTRRSSSCSTANCCSG